MRGIVAVFGLAVATFVALALPFPFVIALLGCAFVLLRTGRLSLATFLVVAGLVNIAIVGWLVSGTPLWSLPFLSVEGATRGAIASIRLGAALGANLAILSWVPAARILDDVPLPRRVRALLAAVLIAAHDVGRDFVRLRDAQRIRGAWPTRRWARVPAAARLVPLVLLSAYERSVTRREALRLAGLDVGHRFVVVVAVAALAAAGRLAFLALPNVALTYVVVFLGGMLFGAFAGAMGGALGMLLTDFLLTGLYPASFVNVPAMMLVGGLGGMLSNRNLFGTTRGDRVAGRLFAASLGIGVTFAFSVATDSLTWLLVLRGSPEAWAGLVLAGLVFNVIPAFVNGFLFATAIEPTLAAFRARWPQGHTSRARAEVRATGCDEPLGLER